MKQTKVEELKKLDKTELLNLFTEAFEGQPPWVKSCEKARSDENHIEGFS